MHSATIERRVRVPGLQHDMNLRKLLPLLALALLLPAASPLRAQDWPGFHGLEKQGLAPLYTLPVTWSTNRGVLWKVPIPGDGHSSPIVHGESVYVTTAYPTPGFGRLRSIIQAMSSVIALAALAGGAWLAWKRWRSSAAQGIDGLALKAGWIGSILLLLLVAAAVVGARHVLRFDGNDLLAWKVSSLVVLLCLAAAALQHPPRSFAWPVLGLLSLGFSVLVWWTFPERDDLLRDRSWPGVTSAALLVAPGLAGLCLIAASLLWRRRKEVQAPEARGAFATGRWAVAAVCLLTASLFFADGAYLQRTKALVRAVISLDAASGKARWVCEGLRGPQRPLTRMNTPATSTPVTDGERVVAWFDSAGVMCVGRDGRLLWTQRELVPAPKYGIVTSPVLRDGIVVFVSDMEEPNPANGPSASWITALDVKTGRPLWRKERRGHKEFASYASPVIMSVSGTNIVCVRGWHDVQGYDLKTGNPIGHYSLELKAHHLAASPVSDGQRLLLVGASGNVCLDLAKWVAGVDPVLWTGKSRGEISATPVIADGQAYLVYEDGLATCLELGTGRVLWEKRLRGRHFSSVLAGGGRVYFCNEAGKTTVAAREREFRLLGEGDLGENIYASVAPLGNRLLIRTVRHLYCIGE